MSGKAPAAAAGRKDAVLSPRVCVRLVALAALAGGCSVGSVLEAGPDGGAGAGSADSTLDTEVMAAVHGDAFRQSGFAQINRAAYQTSLDTGENINLYVSASAADLYRQIHPEATGTGVTLPVGTIIVREVLDGSARSKLTVMARGEPGYFPGGGDWYYAAVAPDGSDFLPGDDGAAIHGASAACNTCHTDRSGDGFLFGVPADMETP